MSGNKLVLVDGHSVLYRSFFAIKGLTTSSGRPTNAVFGFIRMLGQVEKKQAPTHWAVIFDGGLPAERTERYPEYKAQRPPMPSELGEQIGTVCDYLDAARIPWERREGVEADDLLASTAVQARDRADGIAVATSDKDLYQIVDNRISVLALSGKERVVGPDQVREKTGVSPPHVAEWLALTGDACDNITGVPGVGPKTAARLLNEYGSLEGIWEHLDEVKQERLRAALDSHRDTVERNLALVTVDLTLELPFGFEDMKLSAPDPERLLALYRQLEFGSLAKELAERDMFTAMEPRGGG
ncbi:MAG: 5'-3' exonuclease H3TH domain-containing protein [Kiritimatiellia bacterium]